MSDPTTPVPPPPAPAVPVAAVPTGTANYGFGLFAFFPVPVVGLLASAIVMIVLAPSARRRGGVAAENGVRAANWGRTVLALLVATGVLLTILATVYRDTRGFFPVGSVVLVYLAIFIAHVVVCIMGATVASRGEVFDNRLAIPFARARN